MMYPVVIVGSGLTGVMAARTLQDNGINNLLLIDKSRSVGGKMATRRIGAGKADHGAQFFTVRTELFKKYVDEWEKEGLISQWFGDKHYRYKSLNGMNALVKNLARNFPVKLNTKIVNIHKEQNYYLLTTDKNDQFKASGLIMTAPAPQSLELLNSLSIEKNKIKQLQHVTYNPCFVLLLLLKGTSNIPTPGHLTEGLPNGIERIVDHKKKGISDLCTLSVYSTGEWAKEHDNQQDEEIKNMLFEKVSPYFSPHTIQEVQLKRWKYAEASQTHPNSYLDLEQRVPLFMAGDAFIDEYDTSKRARIESAVLSGISAANVMSKIMLGEK